MTQITHEEADTAFSIALKCDHCGDRDDTCWSCTVKMFNLEAEQMRRAEAAEAERDALRQQQTQIREMVNAYPEHDVIEAVRRLVDLLHSVEAQRDAYAGSAARLTQQLDALQEVTAHEWITAPARRAEYDAATLIEHASDAETPLGQAFDGQGGEVES